MGATKPEFYSAEHGAAFSILAVAASYWTRPHYPPETFDQLERLIVDEPRAVLDLGCGTGFIARELAPRVRRVDAIDISGPMIEEARRQPGGDAANIRWVLGAAETAPLEPPYALVTAGSSLHWMDWEVVLPRLADVLTPNGVLAIVEEAVTPPPWQAEFVSIIPRYTANPGYQPGWDWIGYLEECGLLEVRGRLTTASSPVSQPLARYIESFHARESLAFGRLTPAQIAAFDAEMRAIVRRHTAGDQVTLHVGARIIWGKPLRPHRGIREGAR